jgi:hypothetical protein
VRTWRQQQRWQHRQGWLLEISQQFQFRLGGERGVLASCFLSSRREREPRGGCALDGLDDMRSKKEARWEWAVQCEGSDEVRWEGLPMVALDEAVTFNFQNESVGVLVCVHNFLCGRICACTACNSVVLPSC